MYKITYCDACTAVLITDEDIDCLHCNKAVREIGFTDKIIQDILDVELAVEENNG